MHIYVSCVYHACIILIHACIYRLYKTTCDRVYDFDVLGTLLHGFLESTSVQATRHLFGSSRVASWESWALYPVFPKHGLPRQTGRFCRAVDFLLKQSRITIKCDATKLALLLSLSLSLSSRWPKKETFTGSRTAAMKVTALLHLQMLCGYLVRMMPAATSFDTCQQFCNRLKACSW